MKKGTVLLAFIAHLWHLMRTSLRNVDDLADEDLRVMFGSRTSRRGGCRSVRDESLRRLIHAIRNAGREFVQERRAEAEVELEPLKVLYHGAAPRRAAPLALRRLHCGFARARW